MTKVENFFTITKKKILFFVIASLLITIPVARVLKRDKEIARIKTKTVTHTYCVQYALIATAEGYYPCYNCLEGTIYLHIGEVWKYGKTCNGESGRYPSGLPYKNLTFLPEFYGNNVMCLVQEKMKIYSYPLLPECQQREIKLVRPPGNKIDR